MKIKFYSLILGTMIFSFFVSKILVGQVFLANSPKMRPLSSIIARINFHPVAFLNNLTNISFRQRNIQNQQTTAALNSALKSVARGVQASTVGNNSLTVYNIDEVTWVRINYTLKNGKTVIVDYPLGTDPPPIEAFEN